MNSRLVFFLGMVTGVAVQLAADAAVNYYVHRTVNREENNNNEETKINEAKTEG